MRSSRRGIQGAVLLALFVLSLWASASAEEAKNDNYYTLDNAILEALKNNYQVKIRKERVDEARFVKEQARADFFPKLSTNYSYIRLDQATVSPAVPLGLPGLAIPERAVNTKDNYQWRTSVRQPVFTGFALLSTYELTRLGIDRSEWELEQEKLNLILAVKDAYFNILRADIAVNVVRMEMEALQSHLEVARNFYEVGIIPVNDLLKAEVELANAVQNLVRAQNSARNVRAFFNNILARPTHLPVDVEDISAYQPLLFNLEGALDKALLHRPEIKLVNIALLQADQQIRLAGSRYYPEVSVFADYIKEGDTLGVSGSEFHEDERWQAGGLLTWTFWEWGKTKNAVREKMSERLQLLETRENVLHNISLELIQAGLELDQADKNIPTTRKAVEQAEENLRVTQERYKAQVTTTTEVLDAQALLTRARTNYYNALIDHHLAKARLQRAMGGN
jgi:outer membrane protein TolC